MDLLQKKILVLGLGESGRAAAKFLLHKGAFVVGFDKDKSLIESNKEIQNMCLDGLQAFGDEALIAVQDFDLVVVSPGFSPTEKLYGQAIAAGIEIIGEMELGCRFLKDFKSQAIGITGTNGKTTVTLLVEHVLNEAGIKAKAVGNIGTPITSYLLNDNRDSSEILVIELSSFQIETLFCKVFELAVILNITPDHLDRYEGMNDYAMAKIKLKNCMKDKAPLYVNEACYKEFQGMFGSANVSLFGYQIGHQKHNNLYTDLKNVYLKETMPYTWPYHEIENMMAAYAMVKHFNITAEQFLKSYAGFKKPSHRIEFVREVNGISYYDDSKGTNIDAVMKAVEALKQPIYLIAGGVDKGASYAPWKEIFKHKVKAVLAIGEAAEKIRNDLFPQIEVAVFKTLEMAVRSATDLAENGDAVLLSPGCSSYDMFKDYKERGNEFKRVVNLFK